MDNMIWVEFGQNDLGRMIWVIEYEQMKRKYTHRQSKIDYIVKNVFWNLEMYTKDVTKLKTTAGF